jgi:hypothetical protein
MVDGIRGGFVERPSSASPSTSIVRDDGCPEISQGTK